MWATGSASVGKPPPCNADKAKVEEAAEEERTEEEINASSGCILSM